MTRQRRRPNILIFMTDQEQADVTRPDHPCQTPHAERLAREGVRFTRAFCPTAHCCPSRASLMTGVYPSIHGVYNNISNPTAIRRAPARGCPCSPRACARPGIAWSTPASGTSRMRRDRPSGAGRSWW